MKKDFDTLLIDRSSSIAVALQQMDEINRKLLIVVDNGSYFSMLSIGDIQRAIINGVDTGSDIGDILRDNVKVASEGDDIQAIKDHMIMRRNEYMPIVSADGRIQDVIYWEDLFSLEDKISKQKINLPVVIMAGGVGSRLLPLTNVFPKALIPIGEKSIIEQIMDSFIDYECTDFYLSVNHKAEMIKYYFSTLGNVYHKIEYIEEKEFLGTAGSIGLLHNKINSTFFVSNCDILVDQDYADILSYHREQKNEITVVAALLNIKVPYGVLNTNAQGQLEGLTEKPELFYKINTGLYILEPSVFKDIPKNEFYHITDLIEKLLHLGRKVGVFPVSEKSWRDMGNWDEFLKQARIKAQ